MTETNKNLIRITELKIKLLVAKKLIDRAKIELGDQPAIKKQLLLQKKKITFQKNTLYPTPNFIQVFFI